MKWYFPEIKPEKVEMKGRRSEKACCIAGFYESS